MDLAQAIMQSSERLGLPAEDLATIISYETAGTFDPWKKGPTTQWGQHRGLIQWGEPQRQRYGVSQGMPVAAQMQAVERYLRDAGFRPGMGILDAYSAINAGRVGRYNASDANNGGAPGTVRDKVEKQFGPHRANAQRLLGGRMQPAIAQAAPQAAPPLAPPRHIADAPIAAMFAGSADPVLPAAEPAPFGGMALMAAQQQADRRRQQEEERAAEEARRTALLAGVGAMYG